MKAKLFLVLLILLPVLYILTCNKSKKSTGAAQVHFPEKLSGFKLFQGNPVLLVPAAGLEVQELSATLFTDYAKKQRLLKLPPGTKVIINDSGLPVYPEGSILVKTFYYQKNEKDTSQGKQLIETRLLLLKNGRWNAGTYRWNQAQSEAFYQPGASDVAVNWIDEKNNNRKVLYHIPAPQDCISCHQFSGKIIPLGPKAINLNRTVLRNGTKINQLLYLQKKGLLKMNVPVSKIPIMPDDENEQADIAERARAYLDINCAHCHRPGGTAYRQSLALSYQVPYSHTGIGINKRNIIERMSSPGIYHMPKLGTTLLHTEGISLINGYLKSLDPKQ